MRLLKVLLALSLVLLHACSDNMSDYGSAIQPESDKILLGTDTFHLESADSIIQSEIFKSSSKQDSFLLGQYYDKNFGTTKAEILAQVGVCKEGFTFPVGSQPDSALLVLNFNSWFGDAFSPVELSVYEMNKSTFSLSGKYYTDIDPSQYTDQTNNQLLGRKVFSARNAHNSKADSNTVAVKLSPEFVTKFFNNNNFVSNAHFLDFFKGIYVKTDFGSSTLLSVSSMAIQYYYHYTYKAPGADTVTKVNDMQIFAANKEVRQVNRILHPDRNSVKFAGGINCVSAPANIYTTINVPLDTIQKRMTRREGFSEKKLLLNGAILNIDVADLPDSSTVIPMPRSLLLVKAKAVERFLQKSEMPVDTAAIVGQLTATKNKITGRIEYSYSFNLAGMIANELKQLKSSSISPLKLVLMPVAVSQNTTTGATIVSPKFQMCGVAIRGGKNAKPMKLNLVYSGF